MKMHNDTYSHMTDDEIITAILTHPYDEEAAVYLLYVRYANLMHRLALDILHGDYWEDTCVGYVYECLKGKNNDWKPLRSFNHQSRFGWWLKRTAFRCFQAFYHHVIEKHEDVASLDILDGDGQPLYAVPDEGEADYELIERKFLLLDAISELKNKDAQYCIIKHLEGYSSKEIAAMLAQKWRRDGVVKYNRSGMQVVPTYAYVDVLCDRARAELRTILIKK